MDTQPGSPDPYPALPEPWTVPPPAPQLPRSRRRMLWGLYGVGVLGACVGLFLLGRVTATRTAATVTPAAVSPAASATPSPSVSPTSVVSRIPSATAARPTRGFTFSGRKVWGPGFSAVLPEGWYVSADNGSDDYGAAADQLGSTIYYYLGATRPATEVCGLTLDRIRVSSADAVTQLAKPVWGGLTGVATQLVTVPASGPRLTYVLSCVDLPKGSSSMLMATSTVAQAAATKKAVTDLMTTWTWT